MSENKGITTGAYVFVWVLFLIALIVIGFDWIDEKKVEIAAAEEQAEKDSIAALVAEAQADYDIAFTTYLKQRAWLFSPVDSLGKSTPEKDFLFSVFQVWLDSLKSEIVKAGTVDSVEAE